MNNDRLRKRAVGRFAGAPVLLLTAWSLLGCYTYVPVSTEAARGVSGSVRLVLTASGSAALTQTLGANVREVEGIAARSSPDTLFIAVQRTITNTREQFASTGDTVAVPRRFVDSVAVQQYSRKRSTGLIAGIVAFVLIAVGGIVAGSSGTSGTGQPGPSQP